MNYGTERIIFHETCKNSLLRFWLNTKFTVSNKKLQIEARKNILGMFPLGYSLENISYRNISTVKSTSKVSIFKLLFGIWLFTSSFRLMFSSTFMVLGILECLIGLYFLFHSIKYVLQIVSNSGKSNEITVSIFEGRKIRKISEEISNMIS